MSADTILDDGLSRRRFLGTSLAIAALSAAPALQAARGRTMAGLACCDEDEASDFFASLPASCERWEGGLSGATQRLLQVSGALLPDLLVGLTRSAELHVIGQLALERGYIRHFVARHRIDSGAMEHVAEAGDARLLDSWSRVAMGDGAFPQALAQVATRCTPEAATLPVRVSRCVSLASGYRNDHRVSWIFIRNSGVRA